MIYDPFKFEDYVNRNFITKRNHNYAIDSRKCFVDCQMDAPARKIIAFGAVNPEHYEKVLKQKSDKELIDLLRDVGRNPATGTHLVFILDDSEEFVTRVITSELK